MNTMNSFKSSYRQSYIFSKKYNFTVYTFKQSDIIDLSSGIIHILAVAGGGGGGYGIYGGGGAGGMIETSIDISENMQITINIGQGGFMDRGGNTTIPELHILATGGGSNSGNGGSGAGGNHPNPFIRGKGISGEGYDGGTSTWDDFSLGLGGGGGGAGGLGGNFYYDNSIASYEFRGGRGGPGKSPSLSGIPNTNPDGSSIYYAGGGGGYGPYDGNGGYGGIGGGGNANNPGTPNTGGGGGGGQGGEQGGSGIVIIAVRIMV